jgi:hypothetical protein
MCGDAIARVKDMICDVCSSDIYSWIDRWKNDTVNTYICIDGSVIDNDGLSIEMVYMILPTIWLDRCGSSPDLKECAIAMELSIEEIPIDSAMTTTCMDGDEANVNVCETKSSSEACVSYVMTLIVSAICIRLYKSGGCIDVQGNMVSMMTRRHMEIVGIVAMCYGKLYE